MCHSRFFHDQIANATGETLQTIRQRGFGLLRLDVPIDPPETLCLSCPGCGSQVELKPTESGSRPDWAECPVCDIAYPYDEEEIFLPDEFSISA